MYMFCYHSGQTLNVFMQIFATNSYQDLGHCNGTNRYILAFDRCMNINGQI